MGFADVFLGAKPDMKFLDNPYIDRLANQKYNFGPARKYYGGILKSAQTGDFSSMPGMGMFDNAIGQANKDIEHSENPLAYAAAGEAGGPLGERVKQLQMERAREGINGQRYGFAQNQLDSAGSHLQDMFASRNQFNANNLATAGSLRNQSAYDASRKGGLLNSIAQGAGAVGAAYAGKG